MMIYPEFEIENGFYCTELRIERKRKMHAIIIKTSSEQGLHQFIKDVYDAIICFIPPKRVKGRAFVSTIDFKSQETEIKRLSKLKQ